MKHMSEEDLAQHYWGETDRAAQAHLQECAQCAAAFEVLAQQLAAVRADQIPGREENYGERMWARVSAALPPRPAAKTRRLVLWRGLAYAAGCAVLVSGSFWVGRVWEHRQHRGPEAAVKPAASAQPRFVVIVLSDHLERSERLLVELKHADADDSALVQPIQEEARRLLATNRICVENAAKEDSDPRLMKALNELGYVLNQIASEKGEITGEDLARLKSKVNAEGLLFQVRVLRSNAPGYAWTVDANSVGGAA